MGFSLNPVLTKKNQLTFSINKTITIDYHIKDFPLRLRKSFTSDAL